MNKALYLQRFAAIRAGYAAEYFDMGEYAQAALWQRASAHYYSLARQAMGLAE